jgi:hypothetical protein
MPIHIILSGWANNFVSLPAVLIIAGTINWLTAIWMLPIIKTDEAKYTVSSLTIRLCLFSILAGLCGALSAMQSNIFYGFSLLIFGICATLACMQLPKWLNIIVCGISFATFFVGQVAITENATVAFILELCGVTAMLLMALFVVMLNTLTKQPKP